MAATLLTIRNVTSTPIELKLLESYDKAAGSHSANHPSTHQLTESAQSFSHQDVSIQIEPFQALTTDIKVAEKSLQEVLRLTFETEGERHSIDILCPEYACKGLTSLTPNPRWDYTGIYLPSSSYLTLLSSANLASWMFELKDETPLSALSIPGTHNSPACHHALPSVRCQAHSPKTQLENGVRFFDIRVQPEKPEDLSKDGLILVHSVFPVSLTGPKYFRDVVNDISAFLDKNPSETIIISVKREGTGHATDAQLSRILHDHYAGDVNRWFTAPRIPTLGEARRKIVLIRRFGLEDGLKQEWNGAGWAINAETWADNTPNDTCPSGDVCVQDFYEVLETENIEKKIEYSTAHLELAAQCTCVLPGITVQSSDPPPPKHPFYINFLSASNFWKVGCWPERIAAKLNPAIVDFLCRKHNETADTPGKQVGDGSTGIVVCDWVGNNGNWDLIRCIVGMNAKLEMREKAL